MDFSRSNFAIYCFPLIKATSCLRPVVGSALKGGASFAKLAGSLMPDAGQPLRRGFVAMEYYFLILNRSFLVFTYPEGLYGWKFSGLVSTLTPLFFKPFEDMLSDPELIPGSNEFKEIMKESGSFWFPRNEIAAADFVPGLKWGMGTVPHSGKLYVRTTAGKSREFILLGSQDGDAVRAAVLSGTSVAIA